MKRLITVLIFSAVLITAIALFSAAFCAEEASLLTSDKTAYGLNDPINLTAVGSGQDWVGIYRPGAFPLRGKRQGLCGAFLSGKKIDRRPR